MLRTTNQRAEKRARDFIKLVFNQKTGQLTILVAD